MSDSDQSLKLPDLETLDHSETSEEESPSTATEEEVRKWTEWNERVYRII
ncbi:hypothetical protein PAXRUDRAFT_19056 [Paxillus rubicundulus Ve08.2h10]|uniref:Uncharacterized protein n=1 Tax=Paxillus rubicundulus Ve08.2h10 TaxID=930991 RepID=A0A0D0DDE1_9AGAM|nr:hypothetical protein PAXRUDRAFT_19056 [Paxillus rubicundulus Ve08.2h10]